MKTFEGLKEGTILYSPEYLNDGNMTVCYSNYFSETNEKELCFADEKGFLWRGNQFDPADWQLKAQ